jgi:hypothetical protein
VQEHDGWPTGAAAHRAGANDTCRIGRGRGDDAASAEHVGANARGQRNAGDGSVRRELRKLERVMARRAISD